MNRKVDSFVTGAKSNETIEYREPCEMLILKRADLDRLTYITTNLNSSQIEEIDIDPEYRWTYFN